MGISGFFRYVWDVVRRPFTECTDCVSCYEMCDPDYYRKTSPGVRRTPQMFDRWDRDVKYDFTQERPVSSNAPPSSTHSHVVLTQHSKASSGSTYSYEEEDERQVQFLFYGGSDPPTPTSAGGHYSNGYRSDMISGYTQPAEPRSPAMIASPHISHEMPCFFSPRNAPQSPMSAPIYSPHLFKISEQRRSTGYYMRYSK